MKTPAGAPLRVSLLLLLGGLVATPARDGRAQADARASMPRLHHVGLNSVDPERAIEWYLRVWPSAKRTMVAGYPAVEADMLLLFTKVNRSPPGAWAGRRCAGRA